MLNLFRRGGRLLSSRKRPGPPPLFSVSDIASLSTRQFVREPVAPTDTRNADSRKGQSLDDRDTMWWDDSDDLGDDSFSSTAADKDSPGGFPRGTHDSYMSDGDVNHDIRRLHHGNGGGDGDGVGDGDDDFFGDGFGGGFGDGGQGSADVGASPGPFDIFSVRGTGPSAESIAKITGKGGHIGPGIATGARRAVPLRVRGSFAPVDIDPVPAALPRSSHETHPSPGDVRDSEARMGEDEAHRDLSDSREVAMGEESDADSYYGAGGATLGGGDAAGVEGGHWASQVAVAPRIEGPRRAARVSAAVIRTLVDATRPGRRDMSLSDPRLRSVRITAVATDGRLSKCRVHYAPSVGSGAAKASDWLRARDAWEASAGRVRTIVGKALNLRRVPVIEFCPDAEEFEATVHAATLEAYVEADRRRS